MKNLSTRYAALKKLVGGNREKLHYEDSFGMPMEEFWHVTMPNKYNRRILAEIEFAIRLSKENGGQFDEAIGQALSYLEEQIRETGVLTKDACFAAEKMLAPCEKAAKEYSLILAAHAHIDMNWMWGWQETVAAALSTFRTMLHIMDEYPDFCFSQSQSSVYKIVEDYDPDLMQEIKKRIQEGRWEITASAWVETDKNMPNTESLLRHIKYTKDYMKNTWGVDPDSLEVDFSPDTFGHSRNVPELDQYGGVKYYYHCRGLDGDNALYRWKAPSGKEVLVYREQYWYNSAITPFAGIGIIDIAKRSGGLKTGLIVYGVGNHGGGPTRRDVERAIEMNEWPVFPNFRFGTFREFFHIAESVRDNLPVLDQELNMFAPGCYTTQSRLKLGNRHAEVALQNAEAWSALAQRSIHTPYYPKQFEHAWQNVLFTHFHDILTGSCVQESREHAMGLFADSMAVAHTQHSNATRTLSEQIDTSFVVCDDCICDSQSEGAGAGYGLGNYAGVPSPERGAGKTRIFNVFNPSGHKRTQTVEITVWDYTGDLRYLQVEDSKGNIIPHQLLENELKTYWDHKYFRFLVSLTVPAMGYTTIVLKEGDREEYEVYFQKPSRTEKPTDNFILENAFLRAEFDFRNGHMISLIDKKTGEERIRGGEVGSLIYLDTEDDSSSAWNIGRYTGKELVSKTISIHALPAGDLRQGFEMEQEIKGSTVKTTVTLDQDAQAVKYHFTVDWHEVGRHGENIPVLAYHLPLQNEIKEYLYDVPGGAVARPAMNLDVPALQYAASLGQNGRSVALITDCKYGYRGADNSLTATFINSATNPDPYPERGIHNITLCVAVAESCPKALEELATDLNSAMNYQPANSHKGTLPAEHSFLEFNSDTAVLSSVFASDDKALMARVYETCGKDTTVSIKVSGGFEKAQLVDLMEHVTGEVTVEGNTISFPLKANTVQTVKIS